MDGIIVINKEKNCTSHDVVRRAKKVFNEKIGHTGTLDPNATGVLQLLVGQGTKISKYLINHDKIYEATLKLGEKKDTADIEGKTIEKQEVQEKSLEKDNVEKVFKEIIGKQKQIPPIYSAIKVKGKKLYEYARTGQNVEIKAREIEIYDIKLININKENKEIIFKVKCSKGTYIRTLCENIAEKLESIGYMKELKRVQVGEFSIENSIKIEELENNFNNQEFMEKYFIELKNYFSNFQKLKLDDKDLKKFLNGVQISFNLDDGIYNIYDMQNKFIGLAILKNRRLKRDIIL